MSPVASFHLMRHASRRAALMALGPRRVGIGRTPGLTFHRVLGTGAGSDTGPGADLRRTALFAMWRDVTDLQQWVNRCADEPRWRDVTEAYHVGLRALGGHGAWRGRAVLDELSATQPVTRPVTRPATRPTAPPATQPGSPIAVITRANVRPAHWRAFRAAGPAVSAGLQQAPGLLAVVGIGETPLGRLGTFSLWRSAADARAFAVDDPDHRRVVRTTRADGWYGEELFARFQPFALGGTWDGRDPLADEGSVTG